MGTALIDPKSKLIEHLGVRIFPAGTQGDLDKGKEKSNSVKRRDARAARRQTQRRHRRLYKVFHLLQRAGLLPAGPRSEVLEVLDRDLGRRYQQTTVLPWFLRARALDQRLEPYELGRALYHLAQRRGFLSNRSGATEDEKERSTVKGAIKGLGAAIEAAGKRTLGEYMASLDPHKTPLRNKEKVFSDHYTHRSMFEKEFDLIWEAQRAHQPEVLTDGRKAKLHHAIFHQRPLKDQSYLVGNCELEPGEKRAPMRALPAQRFRVLGFVNNLRVMREDGTNRGLTVNERATLLDLCEKRERLTFAAARKALNVGKMRFTIEEGGETNVPVNLTGTRIRKILGGVWDELTPEQQDDLVEDLGDPRRQRTDAEPATRLMEKWKLAPDVAEKLAEVKLPDGYGRYSLKALIELLPALEKRKSVEEAIKDHAEYSATRKPVEPLALLPPLKDECVKKGVGEIRNPTVLRALTELRKTVNAIIRRWGKPGFIHVELARDLKKSRGARQKESARMREREKLRKLAIDELKKHDPVRYAQPNGRDIDKYLLFMESREQLCPYTGRKYSFVDVFGEHPQVDIEHIIPRARSLDDSFENKVLCYRAANAEKGERTPREWLYGSDRDRYDRMIACVKGFDARFNVGQKLRRFAMELSEPGSLLQEFTQRQLQDTRYASKLACRYLGLLHGGEVDACGTRRVMACAGQVTAKLRMAWDLNGILSDKPEKSRDDHRHHAVDALVVAFSSAGLIQALASAAGEADRLHRRRIILSVPWPRFGEQARAAVERIKVSHRPMRKLSGALHDETFYSAPRRWEEKKKDAVHYRVPVTTLRSAKDYERIVDSKVREAVEKKAVELGSGGDTFQNNWPQLKTRKGNLVPIRRVRIRKVRSLAKIGKGGAERYVIPGSNHHMEVLAEIDERGKVRGYDFCTVDMLKASERNRLPGVAVVQRDHGPGYEFRCTLSEGDLVEARRPEDGTARIWRVRSVREGGQMKLSPAEDARKGEDEDSNKAALLWSPAVAALFGKYGGRKVIVTRLGEVLPAGD